MPNGTYGGVRGKETKDYSLPSPYLLDYELISCSLKVTTYRRLSKKENISAAHSSAITPETITVLG